MFVDTGNIRKDGTRPYRYKCSANARDSSSCKNRTLRVERLEGEVLSFLERLLDKEELEKLLASKENHDQSSKIKELKRKIKDNTVAINNLIDKLMLLSNEASEFITKKIEQLTLETNNLKNELLKLERTSFIDSLDKKNIDVLHDQITNFLSLDDDIEIRRYNIKTIVESISWDSESQKISIELL